MSDYTPTTNFTAKDSLPTGNPSKVVSGVDIDLELTNIQTAVATKVDAVGSGLALASKTISLDIASLTNVTPAAGDEFLITDVSDSGNPKAVLFSELNSTLQLSDLGDYAGTFIEDIHAMVDPQADRILFWDDSAGAVSFLTASTGLIVSGATLTTNDPAINHDNLLNFVANEHINHGSVSITAGTGLSGGGTIVSTRTLNLDISGLSDMTAAPVGTDYFLYVDGSTHKKMSYNDVALPSRNVSSSGNFASTDVGEIVYWTGTSGTLTMPTGVGQDDCYIIIINSGSGTLSIAGSGVTINSANSLKDIPAGGMGCLIRETSTVWFLGGSLE